MITENRYCYKLKVKGKGGGKYNKKKKSNEYNTFRINQMTVHV